MVQQAAVGGKYAGLYLNPAAERRTRFEAACGAQFARLLLAGSADAALDMLGSGEAGLPAIDLLVIDLDGFDPQFDHAGLARLVAARGGAPVLALCPFANARWLPLLMNSGPLDYAITPLPEPQLPGLVAQCLARGAAGSPAKDARGTASLDLAALRRQVRAALDDGAGEAPVAERLCRALCGWPGVAHAALFCLEPGGDLQLRAQYGERGLDLAQLLGRGERLLQSPLRHAFPGLLAAASNAMVLLDWPEGRDKTGQPELFASVAGSLAAQGIGMGLGIPIASDAPGAPRGALSLLFEGAPALSREQFDALAELAELARDGLRLAELNRENEELLLRLTQMATLDALTGLTNRRHGEILLEQEIKRARRHGLPLSLIAFDIDRFRDVNARYGHPVGDMALRNVARTAQDLLRASDLLVRSGGEEFLLIAAHTSAVDGLKVAEKLRAAVAATLIPGVDRVTISLGVAQLGEQESADSLTVRVNAALARAKRAGRNCVELAMG